MGVWLTMLFNLVLDICSSFRVHFFDEYKAEKEKRKEKNDKLIQKYYRRKKKTELQMITLHSFHLSIGDSYIYLPCSFVAASICVKTCSKSDFSQMPVSATLCQSKT